MGQEPQGWTRVEEPTGWTMIEPAKPKPVESHPTTRQLASEGPSAMRATKGQAFKGTLKMASEHPGASGAMMLTALAAPFTGGLSIPAAAGVEGLIGAGGAALGHGVNAAATGKVPSLDEVGGDMLQQGLLNAGGVGVFRGVPAVVRGTLRGGLGTATKLADAGGIVGVPGARPIASILRLAQRLTGGAKDAAPVVNPNAGGRLVKASGDHSIESAIGDALEQVKAGPQPTSVSLPPPPTLPRGYHPRTSAPEPTPPVPPRPSPNAGGRLTRPTTPAATPPTANPERAIAEALQELAQPAAAPQAAVRGVVKTAPPQLQASWQKLVTPEPVVPRPDAAPLGLSSDEPIWSRNATGGNIAKDMRGALGAEDAGAEMGLSADAVRDLSGAAKRRPLVADLADMDLGYMRQLANPRGAVPAGLAAVTGAIPGGLLLAKLVEALSTASESSGR